MKSSFYMKLNVCVFASTSENGALTFYFKKQFWKLKKCFYLSFLYQSKESAPPSLGEEGFELGKCKTDVKCCPSWLGKKKKKHSISPKAAVNGIFYLFTLLINIRLVSYTRLSLTNYVKSHLKLFLISRSQTFIFINSKIADFTKHLVSIVL